MEVGNATVSAHRQKYVNKGHLVQAASTTDKLQKGFAIPV